MKSLLKPVLAVFSLIMTAGLICSHTSCTQNKCHDITCQNGGTCTNSSCICPTGYGGVYCQTASRDAFLGGWTVRNWYAMTTTPSFYAVNITASTSNITNITLQNVDNYFTAGLNGYVTNDTIYIPNQQVQNRVVFGQGHLVRSGSNAPNIIYLTTTETDLTYNFTITETDTLR